MFSRQTYENAFRHPLSPQNYRGCAGAQEEVGLKTSRSKPQDAPRQLQLACRRRSRQLDWHVGIAIHMHAL